jgi:hypothetical protein
MNISPLVALEPDGDESGDVAALFLSYVWP